MPRTKSGYCWGVVLALSPSAAFKCCMLKNHMGMGLGHLRLKHASCGGGNTSRQSVLVNPVCVCILYGTILDFFTQLDTLETTKGGRSAPTEGAEVNTIHTCMHTLYITLSILISHNKMLLTNPYCLLCPGRG